MGAAPTYEAATDAPQRVGAEGMLRTHGLLIGCVGVFTGIVALRLPREIGQDTWLSLLVGRHIAHHGIPRHDVFTAWTLGHTWVDQQWLAHLLTYGVYAVGGMILLSAGQVVVLGGSVAAAVAFARRGGATARTVAWLLVGSIYPILLAAGAVRTQTLALPLFVAVLGLLILDEREPGNRVLWTLPLLVLWANLHGSVVVAAALVALRGLVGVAERENRVRNLVLAAAAVAAVGVTPYGTGIVDYYRSTLVNPAFRNIVTEWGPLTPNLTNAPIFLLAGGAIWLLARRARYTGRFTLLGELALIVLTLTAVRSAVWLGLGSVMLLAPALDAELGGKELAVARVNRLVGLFGVAFAAIMLTATLASGSGGLINSYFPPAAREAVARAAAVHPGARIYANERYADWILFERPQLAGRVDFDARFEMLNSAQLQAIFAWTNQITDHWRHAVGGSDVVVLDLPDEAPIERSLLQSTTRFRLRYRDDQVAVFMRSAASRVAAKPSEPAPSP